MLIINCIRLKYIGNKPFILTDENGVKHNLKKGAEVLLPNSDLSRSLLYKKTLFKKLDLEIKKEKKEEECLL